MLGLYLELLLIVVSLLGIVELPILRYLRLERKIEGGGGEIRYRGDLSGRGLSRVSICNGKRANCKYQSSDLDGACIFLAHLIM